MFILTVVTYKMLNSLNFPCQFVNPCLTNMQCLEEKIECCWCLIFMFLWSSNHINFSPNSGFTEVQLEFSPFVRSFDLIHRRRAWLTFHSISDFDFDRVPIWLEPMGLHAVGTVNFLPRASINQRLATVAPLLPPSTSWACVLMAMMAIMMMMIMMVMVAWLAQWTRRRVVMRARSREQALTALAPRALMRYLLCDQPLRLSNVLLLSQQSFGHWIAKNRHWSWCPEIRVCCLVWVRLDNFLLHMLLSNDHSVITITVITTTLIRLLGVVI